MSFLPLDSVSCTYRLEAGTSRGLVDAVHSTRESAPAKAPFEIGNVACTDQAGYGERVPYSVNIAWSQPGWDLRLLKQRRWGTKNASANAGKRTKLVMLRSDRLPDERDAKRCRPKRA